jgi:small subunit ribosomal protein S16
MVKLRLRRMGAIDKPFYRIVAVDSRKKRDGAYLESVGYYDPKTDPLTLKVDIERSLYWLGVGAQPSDTVRSLLKKAGVMEKWHRIRFGEKTEEPKEKKKKVVKKETKPAAKKPTKPVAKPAAKTTKKPAAKVNPNLTRSKTVNTEKKAVKKETAEKKEKLKKTVEKKVEKKKVIEKEEVKPEKA